MFEKVIEVDGEPAVVTLLDTWDAEVRQPVTITALSCQKPCETVISLKHLSVLPASSSNPDDLGLITELTCLMGEHHIQAVKVTRLTH